MSTVGTWLWNIAVLKGVKAGIKVLVSFLAAKGLNDAGIQIDVEKLTLAIVALLEVVRNYLKTKQPKIFGWM